MLKYYIIAIAIIAVIVGGLALENNRLERLNETLQADLTAMQLERDLAKADHSAALSEIGRQNEKIYALAANMEHNAKVAEERITELAAHAGEIRTEYVDRLITDPSCENQLNLIKEAQGAFYENRN